MFALLEPAVAKHFDVHVTKYRYDKEEYGRVWFTWHRAEVARFEDGSFWWRVYPLSDELKALGSDVDDAWKQAIDTAHAEANTDVSRFYGSVLEYLDLPVEDALTSPDFVIRGFAMLDRRVGKRAIAALRDRSDPNPFVRRMYDLRLRAQEPDA
ncbi:MAG TPA: hypothetical protein VE011_01155 [Candidatus Dormibacteraeota bacterium]|nr:hypothetical protein [Candidatus Dormibacteraeota bacterium]